MPSVVNPHATKLLLPFVVGALTDAVATANFPDGSSGLCFLQGRDDLFFTVVVASSVRIGMPLCDVLPKNWTGEI